MPAIISPRKIYDAVEASDNRFKAPREIRQSGYAEFLGNYYSQIKGEPKLLNLTNRGVRVMLAYLAGKHGEVDISARNALYRGQAELGAISVNLLLERIKFIDTIRLGLMDALLGPMAIYRVGLRAGDELYTLQGREYARGVPYLRRVDLDDYVTDVGAKYREQRLFDGDLYDVPREALLDSGLFNNAIIENLPTTTETQYERGPAIGALSGRGSRDTDDLVEYVTLMDVALYADGSTYKATLPACEGYARDFLRIDAYDGPDDSPYEFEEFFPIPGQPYGLPWASIAREQAEAVNAMFARMKSQVDSAKRRIVANKECDQDELKALVEEDEDVVALVDDVNAIKDIQQGGFSPEIPKFLETMIHAYDQQYGGFDISSATSKSGGTATEYTDQAAKAGLIMADPEATHYRVVERLVRKLAFWHFNDPYFDEVLPMRLNGTETIDVSYTAQQLRDDFSRFQFKIRPRSMRLVDPNVKARRTIEFLEFVLKAVEVASITGGYLDLPAIVRVGKDEFDIERADEFINDPVMMAQSMQMAQMVPPAGKGTPQGPVGNGQPWMQPGGMGGAGGMGAMGMAGGGMPGAQSPDPRSVVHMPGRAMPRMPLGQPMRPSNRLTSPIGNTRSALSLGVPQ